MTDFELGYLAGFFDGEGSVTIRKRLKGKYTTYTLYVAIAQIDVAPLKKIRDVFGGHLHYSSKKQYWQLQLDCTKAFKFLEAIYPHLMVKKIQVNSALEFQRIKKHQKAPGVGEANQAKREALRESIFQDRLTLKDKNVPSLVLN